MKEIVEIYGDEPRASSKDLANGFGIEHRAFVILLKKYEDKILERGKLPFQKDRGYVISNDVTVDKGGPSRITYFLNERQATLMGMLQRNSEKSVAFKDRLEKDYHKCKSLLLSLGKAQTTEEWQQARLEGKSDWRSETDSIKNFIEYARSQGSENPDMYYTTFTKMENAALFVVAGKFKNLRDVMTSKQLRTIGVCDTIVERAIDEGMKMGMPYKDVFQLAKQRVITFAALYGKSEVVQKMLETGN